MANQYAAHVPASEVGSYFVRQYYHVFQQQREYVHQFYNESSTVVRVDGEMTETASDMETIHQLLTSLNFTGIEIKTINSLDSWNNGVLVVVSGFVKLTNINVWRTFVQTFFLAPQDKGYFVLNDMFQFAGDEVIHQASAPVPAQQHNVDYHQTATSHLPDPTVSEYAVGEEEYVHTEVDEPVQEYSYHQEHLQQPNELELEPEFEPEAYTQEVETYEEPSPWPQSTVTAVQEPKLSAEEPTGETEKLSYASILRAKGKSPPSVNSQPAFTQRPPVADWNHVPLHQPLPQQSPPNIPNYGADVMEKALSSQEGESKSVYVRNLPSNITSLEIMQAFQNFGKITHDGVFLKDVADSGVCYAFVEFEDVKSVHNALQASPIQLVGRNVYIEERRPNSGASRGGRGGGRGRGRGGRFYGK